MLEKQLKELGLTEKQAKIYLATLELGETTIERIAKKSGIKRTTIYGLLDELKSLGLIGITKKKNKNFYFAHNPRKLESQIQEKSKIIAEIMPQLLSISNFFDKKPKISFFEGKEEINSIHLDILNHPNHETMHWITESIYPSYIDPFWYKYYIPQRIEKKIWLRIILTDAPDAKKLKLGDHKEFRETRICAKNFIKSNIFLYGEKNIAILSFDEMMGIVIESKQLFDTLKNLFELHWQSLEK